MSKTILLTEKDRIYRKLQRRCVVLDSGCWKWFGATNSAGYGVIGVNKKLYLAHRMMAHVMADFDLESPNLICHRCDVRFCINPEHLYIGTASSNQRDKHKEISRVL